MAWATLASDSCLCSKVASALWQVAPLRIPADVQFDESSVASWPTPEIRRPGSADKRAYLGCFGRAATRSIAAGRQHPGGVPVCVVTHS